VQVTEILAARRREIAGAGATVLPATARFDPPYIASRAAAAIGGDAALDAVAEPSLEKPIISMANPSGPTSFPTQEAPKVCQASVRVVRHCATCRNALRGSGQIEPQQVADLIGARWHGF